MQTWFRRSPKLDPQKHRRHANRRKGHTRGKFLSAFALEQLERRVLLAADLAATKISAPPTGPVVQGELVTYTVAITNTGTTAATGVTFSDTLPAGLTFVSATGLPTGSLTASGNTVSGSLGDLPALIGADTVTIQATVNSTATGTIAGNTAAVTDSAGDTATSPATAPLTVTALPATGTVDVSIAKTAANNNAPVNAGGSETYTITVTNNDTTTTAAGVTVIDALPAGATGVTGTNSAGTFAAPVGNVATETIGTLAPGATATITISLTAPATPGAMVNAATVASTTPDRNLANNVATVVTPLSGTVGTTSVDLGVTKTAAPTSGTVGTNEVYTVVVTNHSTTAATGVMLVDTLPANATFVSATGPAGALTPIGTALTDTIGNLAAGASATVTVTVTPTTPGVIVNSAIVEGNELDTNQLNNTATVTTPVNGGVGTTAVDLGVTKTAAPTSGTVGTNEVYTIVVTNHSTGTGATGVTLVDTLPANATFVSATGPGGALTPVGPALTDTIGNLAAGASATLTVTVTPTTPGVVTNTAVVEGNELDTNQLNNTATVTTPVNGGVGTTAIDLGVTKTAAPTSGTVNTNEIYTIVVTNHSTTAATGVTLVDTLPANATFVSATGPGGALTPVGTALTDAIGNLAAGASATVTVTVTPTTPGVIANTAVVEGNELDTNQLNNVATVTTPVNGGVGTTAVDLGVTKTAAPTSGTVGTNEVYTIVVTNHSTTTATGVTLVDTLPANATFVSATGPGGALTPIGTALTDSIGNLAAGASDTITVTVTPTTPGVIVNTAVVEGNELDTNQTNNVATVATPVNGGVGTTSVDLGVTKTAAPTSGTVGTNEVYTIVVTNHSTTAATGVTLVDTLPANATFVSATGPGGALTPVGTALTDSIGNLAAGASDTITVTVTPTTPGVIVNTAVVEGNELDTNQTNNVATVTTPVNGGVGTTSVDLGVTKTAAPTSGTVGANEVYTIVVTNHSTTAATGVTLVDTLPANATFVSATGPGGALTPIGTALTDSIGNLAAGASDTITVTVTPTTPGVIANTAVVEGNELDTNQTNNVATVVTPISGVTGTAVDLSVTKTAAPTTGTVGTNEVYTIVVTNNSASTGATGVTLIDTLPANATFVSATGGLTPTAGVLTDSIGNLAAGASDTISVTVTPTTPGVITNTAVVEGTQPDTNQLNNVATVVTPVQGTTGGTVDVSVTKTAGTNPAVVGSNEVYTIVITNAASSSATATGVTLIDTLPTNATFVSATGGLTPTAGVLTDTIGSLAAGASATVTVTVKPTSGTVLVNTAVVAEDQVDTNNANNTATVSVPISTGVTGATLSISKLATPEPVSAGGQLTYTIVVNNSGTAAATGTVLTDTLPAGLTFASATDSTGTTVTNSGGALTDNIGSLAAGGSDTITVVANVGSSLTAGQTIVNTASVSSPDFNGGAAITAQATSTIAGVTVPPGHICYVAGTPGDGTDATFVTNLYRELLGRDPDSQGQAGWMNFLQTGNGFGKGKNETSSQRREDVIEGFLNSQEYKLHLVSCVYENFLGRAPDAGGLAFWVDKLGNPGQEGGAGGSRDLKFVVAAIAGSDEFFLRAGGTTQGWVDALYQDILGRAADGSGQSFWMSEAQHRNANDRDGIVRDLLNTSEAEHKLLNATYPTLGTPGTLGAPGTSAGGTYALADLTGGGWENLYFNGPYDSAAGNNNGNVNSNDVFFAKLQGQTPWDDVIEDMLESDAYFNNHNQVGTLATGTSSTTLGTGGTP